MDSIYVKAANINANYLDTNLETLLIINIFNISSSNNIKLNILLDDTPSQPLFRVYLSINKFHLITPETVPTIATYCIWPVIVVGNTVVAGLCSVSRQIIKSSQNKDVESLLGFREACLMACSESSIWTKFCEVDMIQTVKDVFTKLTDSKSDCVNQNINKEIRDAETNDVCTKIYSLKNVKIDCCIKVGDAAEVKAISMLIGDDKIINDVSTETNDICTKMNDLTFAPSDNCNNISDIDEAKAILVNVGTKINDLSGALCDKLKNVTKDAKIISKEVECDGVTGDICTETTDLSIKTASKTNDLTGVVNESNEKDIVNELTKVIGTKIDCIDIPVNLTAINETSEKNISNDLTKIDCINIPIDLTRFEYHMQQPVRIHNIYKIAREKNKCKDLKSSVPLKDLNIPHCYSEGPYLTLADTLLYPCIYLVVQVYTHELIKRELPLTYIWYKNMESNNHLTRFKFEVLSGVSINLKGKSVVQQDIPQESLYSSDPNRYRPQSRIYTKQTNIEHSLNLVNQSEIGVENLAIPFGHDVDFNWKDVPLEVNPEGGSLPKSRSLRKCQQLENLTRAVLKISKDNNYTIVDFCSGSGHLGLLLAVLLPKCRIILVENKERSLIRAKKTVTILGLTNVVLLQCNLDYFQAKFNLGVSLHACGVATDLVIQNCILNQAHFVSCPCCYGGIHDCYHLQYPRSEFYRGFISYGNYLHLAHAADQTHDSKNVKTKQGYKCMDIIDTDRKLYAEKCGYVVYLGKLIPASCTPKNNLIVGIFK